MTPGPCEFAAAAASPPGLSALSRYAAACCTAAYDLRGARMVQPPPRRRRRVPLRAQRWSRSGTNDGMPHFERAACRAEPCCARAEVLSFSACDVCLSLGMLRFVCLFDASVQSKHRWRAGRSPLRPRLLYVTAGRSHRLLAGWRDAIFLAHEHKCGTPATIPVLSRVPCPCTAAMHSNLLISRSHSRHVLCWREHSGNLQPHPVAALRIGKKRVQHNQAGSIIACNLRRRAHPQAAAPPQRPPQHHTASSSLFWGTPIRQRQKMARRFRHTSTYYRSLAVHRKALARGSARGRLSASPLKAGALTAHRRQCVAL